VVSRTAQAQQITKECAGYKIYEVGKTGAKRCVHTINCSNDSIDLSKHQSFPKCGKTRSYDANQTKREVDVWNARAVIKRRLKRRKTRKRMRRKEREGGY